MKGLTMAMSIDEFDYVTDMWINATDNDMTEEEADAVVDLLEAWVAEHGLPDRPFSIIDGEVTLVPMFFEG